MASVLFSAGQSLDLGAAASFVYQDGVIEIEIDTGFTACISLMAACANPSSAD